MQTSTTQRLVAETLQALGLPAELEYRLPDFSIDIAIPRHKVAVEVRACSNTLRLARDTMTLPTGSFHAGGRPVALRHQP